MSTAPHDQDFPDVVSSDDRLDVFASHYAGTARPRAHEGTAVPGSGHIAGALPTGSCMTEEQARRFAGALEDAQRLRAELQKRDREIARTRDVLGIVKWLCSEIGGRIDDEDHETHADILRHIHTLIGLI